MCSDKNERDLLHVPELGHLGVVVVDGVEASLVLQAEDKDDGVHPGSELKKKEKIKLPSKTGVVNSNPLPGHSLKNVYYRDCTCGPCPT